MRRWTPKAGLSDGTYSINVTAIEAIAMVEIAVRTVTCSNAGVTSSLQNHFARRLAMKRSAASISFAIATTFEGCVFGSATAGVPLGTSLAASVT